MELPETFGVAQTFEVEGGEDCEGGEEGAYRYLVGLVITPLPSAPPAVTVSWVDPLRQQSLGSQLALSQSKNKKLKLIREQTRGDLTEVANARCAGAGMPHAASREGVWLCWWPLLNQPSDWKHLGCFPKPRGIPPSPCSSEFPAAGDGPELLGKAFWGG